MRAVRGACARIVVNECEARRVLLCVFVLFRRCFCQAYRVLQMACRVSGLAPAVQMPEGLAALFPYSLA